MPPRNQQQHPTCLCTFTAHPAHLAACCHPVPLPLQGHSDGEWQQAYEAAEALRDSCPDLHEEMARSRCVVGWKERTAPWVTVRPGLGQGHCLFAVCLNLLDSISPCLPPQLLC